MRMIKVCYVLPYKAPEYVRTTTLVEALRLIPNIQLFEARNTSKGILRYIQTFLKFLKIKFLENPDVYIIGFRGHEIYWILRIFALRKTFVFDEMMSPYDSLVNERRKFHASHFISRIVYWLEKSILVDADYILTDTNLHAELFNKLFGISKKKIIPIPVGTDEKLFDIENTKAKDFGDIFTVFFYGTFLPLHGVDVILKAAKLLEDLPIKFIIVGGRGKEKALEEFNSLVKELELKNIEHHEWLEFEELPKYIKGADLCLGGPFGGTPQARRVVTGKTYQFLSMGKPTVIGKIDEDFGFIDKKNCLLVEQNNPVELSQIILWMFNNIDRAKGLGKSGQDVFRNRFSVSPITIKLKQIF